MTVECSTCKKGFNKPPCQVKRAKAVYCSKACYDWAQTKYRGKQCSICGEVFKIRGNMKRYSTCPKEACRKKKKTKENNPNWRGGITKPRHAAMSTKRYKTWRQAVFERDDYTCRKCGQRGGELNADHIKAWAAYKELRYVVGNGRTLCVKCHKKTYKASQKQVREKRRAP